MPETGNTNTLGHPNPRLTSQYSYSTQVKIHLTIFQLRNNYNGEKAKRKKLETNWKLTINL